MSGWTVVFRGYVERVSKMLPPPLHTHTHSMILTQYLHQLGKQCDLSAVIAVSMSWQPFMTRKSLEEGPLINKWVYSRLMVTNIQGMVKRCVSVVGGKEVDGREEGKGKEGG